MRYPNELVMNLIVEPEMSLLEILQKISSKIGLNLPSNDYLFTQECPEFKKLKDEDFLKYSKMNNEKIFNLNQKVKDLNNFDLLLIRKIYADSSSNKIMQNYRKVDSFKRYSVSTSQSNFKKLTIPDSQRELDIDVLGMEYKEFYAYMLGITGDKTCVIIGIDSLYVYVMNKEHSNTENKYISIKKLSDKMNSLRIPLRSIFAIEKSIFDDKRLYFYFNNNSNTKERYDFLFDNPEEVNAFYNKIHDIILRKISI